MNPMPPYSDISLANAPDVLAELVGRAGEPGAVSDGVRVVESVERSRAAAPEQDWAAWDEVQRRALKTLRVLRDYDAAEPEPEPEWRSPLVPRPVRMTQPCEVRRRPR